MRNDLVPGIDIGTTRVKATAFDLRGRAVSGPAPDYPTLRRPGGVVQPAPADWLARVAGVLARVRWG